MFELKQSDLTNIQVGYMFHFVELRKKNLTEETTKLVSLHYHTIVKL